MTVRRSPVEAVRTGLDGADSAPLSGREGRRFNRGRAAARISAQRGNSIEQLAAVPERRNAEFLQVFRRQLGQDPFVDLILAECRLVLCETKAPQPDHYIHNGAPCRVRDTSFGLPGEAHLSDEKSYYAQRGFKDIFELGCRDALS